jgi:hypothetical protein
MQGEEIYTPSHEMGSFWELQGNILKALGKNSHLES